jgi:hypothetical protein
LFLPLDINSLILEAKAFSEKISSSYINELVGVTDGKKIGTYLEHKFQDFLEQKFVYERGSSASGLDFPELLVDMKVTSVRQPQSSSPFRSARQKIYGLGYSLLLFVYSKDDTKHQNLNILHTVFIEADKTADYQTTTGVNNILNNNGNRDDLVAFFEDRRLPIDEIEANNLADEVLLNPPQIGYLTISNALQWRLQYSRVISEAGKIQGIIKI